LKKRSTELSVVRTPRSADSRCTISASVRSGSVAIRSNSHEACGASGERGLRPFWGLTLPVDPWRSTHRIADDGLTLNRSAADRRDAPAATSTTARPRMSSE
jgi:hypothetical protein